ncbi:MAG TPA: heme exporter protein CcmB [Actinomycetota bacterium]|nr:heme exporter protein CcmB [Actinomycetota bacterium]
MSEQTFVAKTLTLARKDLRIETRAWDTLPPMAAFALAVTLLLSFTLPARGAPGAPRDLDTVLAGFFWITVLFAGLIGFARTFETERSDGALEALLLAPLDRSGLFLAKATANLVYIVLVEALLLPAFILFFSLTVGPGLAALLVLIVLVDVGFVAVGTLFAAVAAQTRSRELVLPILALPALVPIFIAAVELTGELIGGASLNALANAGWFGILVVSDIVFGVIAALAFDFILD